MSENNQYLEWEPGENEVFLTSIEYKNDEGRRPSFKLTFISESGKVDAPFTSSNIYFPNANDTQFTRIMMDKRLKNVILPIAEIDPNAKVKVSEVYKEILERLKGNDMKVNVHITQREGKSTNPETGDPIIFSEIDWLKPLEYVAKVPYESTVDWDDIDDIPF